MNIDMKSKSKDNIYVSNGGQISTGFFNFQSNSNFSIFSFFKNLFKKEVIKIPHGVFVQSISTSGNKIKIELSNGETINRTGRKVATTEKEIILG